MNNNNYWNIYGKVYDLDNFLDKHPGGRKILELSRSERDITPLFESYHAISNLDSIKKDYIGIITLNFENIEIIKL